MIVWRKPAFAVVRILLGVLLLAAAGLKLYGWSVSTVPPIGRFSAPGTQAAAIGWELALGAWLLSGVAPVGSWLAALGTFTLFASISGYLGWIGQAKCGCFGAIEASPWHAFAVDVVALGLLGISEKRQSIKKDQSLTSTLPLHGIGYVILSVGLIFATLTVIGTWVYGSPEIALTELRNEGVTISPRYVDFGIAHSGDVVDSSVKVHNGTDKSIRLIGGTSDCSCVTTRSLPITISAGETQEITIRLRLGKSDSGMFTRTIELWKESSNHASKIRFKVMYHVD